MNAVFKVSSYHTGLRVLMVAGQTGRTSRQQKPSKRRKCDQAAAIGQHAYRLPEQAASNHDGM